MESTRATAFIGIDLGGPRGKTTAVARLAAAGTRAQVVAVLPYCEGEIRTRWTDQALLHYLAGQARETVVAIDAPLTAPACVRCALPYCPGVSACPMPATQWLLTQSASGVARADDSNRIAQAPWSSVITRSSPPPTHSSGFLPYAHRCTDVRLHLDLRLRTTMPLTRNRDVVAARAQHLRRVLHRQEFALNTQLIEVSPRATIAMLVGQEEARRYKRATDPWRTRAKILDHFSDSLSFAPSSRLAKELVLTNDHCFDAVISGFTAFLATRDQWPAPEAPFDEDGWIWLPE